MFVVKGKLFCGGNIDKCIIANGYELLNVFFKELMLIVLTKIH